MGSIVGVIKVLRIDIFCKYPEDNKDYLLGQLVRKGRIVHHMLVEYYYEL